MQVIRSLTNNEWDVQVDLLSIEVNKLSTAAWIVDRKVVMVPDSMRSCWIQSEANKLKVIARKGWYWDRKEKKEAKEGKTDDKELKECVMEGWRRGEDEAGWKEED